METGEDTSGASGHGNSMELERHWKTEKLREWAREGERERKRWVKIGDMNGGWWGGTENEEGMVGVIY